MEKENYGFNNKLSFSDIGYIYVKPKWTSTCYNKIWNAQLVKVYFL